MNTFELIYEQVKRIPHGRVSTYGAIARMAGNPRWSQVVGYALHVNPDPQHIPCHRVVNRFGQVCSGFAFGGADIQKSLLENEGIEFLDENTVDMGKHLWIGE